MRTRRVGRRVSSAFRRPRRTGFSLIEIVVALTIIIVLAAIVTYRASAADDLERYRRVAKKLEAIARAITFFEHTRPPYSFRQTVFASPSRLSQLTKLITVSDVDSCKLAVYSAAEVARWKGPYYSREFPLNGTFRVEDGFVLQDTLVRDPATGDPGPYAASNPPPRASLKMVMLNVTPEDAKGLADVVDGDQSGTIGAVRFTLSGVDPIPVYYGVEIRGC